VGDPGKGGVGLEHAEKRSKLSSCYGIGNFTRPHWGTKKKSQVSNQAGPLIVGRVYDLYSPPRRILQGAITAGQQIWGGGRKKNNGAIAWGGGGWGFGRFRRGIGLNLITD